MKTYVTTCPASVHLLNDFLKLADLFYGEDIIIHIADSGEYKSEQLKRLCESIEDDYFILLEEDAYLINTVDLKLLSKIRWFGEIAEVDRFTLQSKNNYRVTDWDTVGVVSALSVYQATKKVLPHFGLDASIWKKQFLLDHLGDSQNDWAIETHCSSKVRNGDYKIYGLDVSIMDYRDAMRGGKQVLELHDNPLRLVAETKNIKALYPQGGGSETLILGANH